MKSSTSNRTRYLKPKTKKKTKKKKKKKK